MSKQMLTDGSPVPPDYSHTAIDPVTGMQRGYVVLSPGERAKGFVKPVRRGYLHKTCGTVTTMGTSLAETYARNPSFYSGTFCCGCRTHFNLDQFTWEPDGEPMDPNLQDAWQQNKGLSDAEGRFLRATQRVGRALRELDEANKEKGEAEHALSLLKEPAA